MDILNPTTPEPTSLLYRRHLQHLALTLQPLFSITSGTSHPAFPRSILAFHLLTERQLDDLAHFYHQRTPTFHSLEYPAPIIARWQRDADIEDKRRRFGRFLGLRGCESPVVEGQMAEEMEREMREMEAYVEARIRRGMEREVERDMWRSKGF